MGTAAEGQTLTADTSGIGDDDGLGVFTYQWLRDGADIAGATGSRYTVASADAGSRISVVVSYADSRGGSESVTSSETAAVADVDALAAVPATDGSERGTLAVPFVIHPGTVQRVETPDPARPRNPPQETPPSPLAVTSYRSSSGGGTVNKPDKVSNEQAEGAEVSEDSEPGEDRGAEQDAVAAGASDRTELAALLTPDPLAEGGTQSFRRQEPPVLMRASDYQHLRDSLDAVKQEMTGEGRLNKIYLGSAIVSSIGLSVGYVVWMLRGGMLLASLLSSMPAWQFLDPLPILARKKTDESADDKESLESIVEKQQTDPAKKTEDAPSDAEAKRR
jgi:hypothetical protein